MTDDDSPNFQQPGGDNSSDLQRPGDYYYQPLRDDGPFEKNLQQAGEILGRGIIADMRENDAPAPDPLPSTH